MWKYLVQRSVWSERRVLHRCADPVMKGCRRRQAAHDARVPDSASDITEGIN